ncbi:hypothetical protein DW355_14775 [Hylemonella gracilis]|uniref:DUF962 domain-containing protein n=1 Tax=Hylemonella gracilis TaxID=80880 RepID=A0A4V1A2F0_9BURK|nr:hypothetical protein [Hylemonella gracilis]QBK05819.1 hypothetical protein DW355_14775 [Hylemonella gracilis]
MSSFLHDLKVQRWDDHRYYHHSRINQSLHFISAISFLVAYAFLIINPPVAGLIGWLISMVTRQSGHFFFEPRGYDHINQVTDEYKEEIKVGFNIQRKVVLMAVWAGLPLALWLDPDFFGLMEPHQDLAGFVLNVGWLWLWLGASGLLVRVLQLWRKQNLYTGIVWATKILTDPFHDIVMYWKSPYYLFVKRQLIDPGHHLAHEDEHKPEFAQG